MFVPYVLTEVDSHRDERFLIMTDIDNIESFLRQLNLPNARFLRFRQTKGFVDILNSRRELLSSTAQYNIKKVIFFHAEFGGIINWFIRRKAKSAIIYYCKVYNSLPYPCAKNFKALRRWLYNYVVYGVRMPILYNNPYLIPTLPRTFFHDIGAIPYSIDINHEKIKELLSSIMKNIDHGARYLILTGSTVAEGYVGKDEYVLKMNALINALGKENCITKCHPRFSDVLGIEQELHAIPSYIPGNLIVQYFDVFIGNHSTLLVEAAISGKIAISLVDYLNQIKDGQAASIKAFYSDRLNGKGMIYYPNSIEKVIELIKKLAI